MKSYKLLLAFTLFLAFAFNMKAQYVHERSDQYTPPEDSLVIQKLHHWQDQKFGMLIHWGLYSVAGIVESWSICSEEADWIPRDSTMAYEDYKKWYWGLKDSFNPTRFDPEQWAQAAKSAGMRYAIFTTKHHDGFNMFNTAFSDFSIAKGPFQTDPRADVAKYVFEAFRNNDLMVGAYFSKPDWHSEYYWWPRYATPRRTQNYNIDKNPWRWNQFKEFTYNQIGELMHNYGPIDILWLDGGWVNNPGTKSVLDMDRISQMARQAQPGILFVDRTIHGKYENYQTPEQQIPDKQLPYPWKKTINLDIEHFEFQAKKALSQAASDLSVLPSLREQIEMERNKINAAKAEAEDKLKRAEALEIGAEIGHGTLERTVEITIGTDIDALMGAEILTEDGKIIAFRE